LINNIKGYYARRVSLLAFLINEDYDKYKNYTINNRFFFLWIYFPDIILKIREQFFQVRICNNSENNIRSSHIWQYHFWELLIWKCSKFIWIWKINDYEFLEVELNKIKNINVVWKDVYSLGIELNNVLFWTYTINVWKIKGFIYEGNLHRSITFYKWVQLKEHYLRNQEDYKFFVNSWYRNLRELLWPNYSIDY